jgi:hypothetical protein
MASGVSSIRTWTALLRFAFGRKIGRIYSRIQTPIKMRAHRCHRIAACRKPEHPNLVRIIVSSQLSTSAQEMLTAENHGAVAFLDIPPGSRR